MDRRKFQEDKFSSAACGGGISFEINWEKSTITNTTTSLQSTTELAVPGVAETTRGGWRRREPLSSLDKEALRGLSASLLPRRSWRMGTLSAACCRRRCRCRRCCCCHCSQGPRANFHKRGGARIGHGGAPLFTSSVIWSTAAAATGQAHLLLLCTLCDKWEMRIFFHFLFF